MGVKEPNYTQIPNELFGLLPQMKDAELRVILAICRQTFGWHRKKDKISLTQLQQLTGLSRQGVVNGLAGKIAKKIIRRKQDGDGYIYWLKVVNEVDQVVNGVDQGGSQRSRLELVNEVDRQLVNEVDTQKKELKKVKEREAPAPEKALPETANIEDGKVRARTATDSDTGSPAWAEPTLARVITAAEMAGVPKKMAEEFFNYNASLGWPKEYRHLGFALKAWQAKEYRFASKNGTKVEETPDARAARIARQTEIL